MSKISLKARAAGSTNSSASSRGEARMVQQVSLAASKVPSEEKISPRAAGSTASRSCWSAARAA